LSASGEQVLDFRQLKYFVGIVEAGSITKASGEMNVAQSALSLHVRQMEEGFGVSLLVRERTGIRVTDQGAKLLEHAKIILKQVALAEAELTSKITSPAGEVTIGIPSGAARVMVSELLATAREVIPNVSLKIIEGMTGPLEEWMAAGRFNLAVLYRPSENIGRATELAREEFCLVAQPEKPPFTDSIELAEVQSFPLAVPMPSNNVRRSVVDAMARFGFNLDVRFEVDSLSTILKMVAEGKAYSILTPSAVQGDVKAGLVKSIKIVDPIITRSVVVMANPRDERQPAVSATRAVLIDVVRKLVTNGEWPASLPN
jgi:LysR family nitrogen assimilation transcriptional regulator